VDERPVEQDARIPRSRRPIAVADDQTGDESPYSISPWASRGELLSQTQKAEALAESLETQFQPVIDTSVPTVIETVDVALRSYFLTPAREHQLTNHGEIQEAIFPSERYPAWFRSMQGTSPTISLLCGSTLK